MFQMEFVVIYVLKWLYTRPDLISHRVMVIWTFIASSQEINNFRTAVQCLLRFPALEDRQLQYGFLCGRRNY